jgi:TonB family protein
VTAHPAQPQGRSRGFLIGIALALTACPGDSVAPSTPRRGAALSTEAPRERAEPRTEDQAESFEPPAVPFTDFDEPVLRVGGVVMPPVKVFWPKPTFPRDEKRLRGQVVLQSILGSDGAISRVRVDKSLHPAYDEECMAALRQWRFEPARMGGRAVNVYFRLTVNFIPRQHGDA